jgi:hypothetical protein
MGLTGTLHFVLGVEATCGQEVVHDAFAIGACHGTQAGQPQEEDRSE